MEKDYKKSRKYISGLSGDFPYILDKKMPKIRRSKYSNVRKMFENKRDRSESSGEKYEMQKDLTLDYADKSPKYLPIPDSRHLKTPDHSFGSLNIPNSDTVNTERDSAYASPENRDMRVHHFKRLMKLQKIGKTLGRASRGNELYQGIIVISDERGVKREFYIEMSTSGTKFRIIGTEIATKIPHLIELHIPQAKHLLKQFSTSPLDPIFSHQNFNNLVFHLGFSKGRFHIKDLHKHLYQDFSSFASTPRDKIMKSRRSIAMPKSPMKYFKNKRKTAMEKSQKRAKLKSRLSIDNETTNSAVYSQLQTLLNM